MIFAAFAISKQKITYSCLLVTPCQIYFFKNLVHDKTKFCFNCFTPGAPKGEKNGEKKLKTKTKHEQEPIKSFDGLLA